MINPTLTEAKELLATTIDEETDLTGEIDSLTDLLIDRNKDRDAVTKMRTALEAVIKDLEND